MKALSVRQPYAFAITHGFKPVENRDWKPNNPGLSFRGPVLIHAGKREETDDVDGVLRQCAQQAWVEVETIERGYRSHHYLGGIVGAVTITDVVIKMDDPWFHGPYGLVMTTPVWGDCVPCKGALGFFEVHEAILRQLHLPPYVDAMDYVS